MHELSNMTRISFFIYRQQLRHERILAEKKENPSNFGVGCQRPCICMVPGQVPCPGQVPLPQEMRGKYWINRNKD